MSVPNHRRSELLKMAYDFTGKTFVVTGAGRGIGRSTVESLVKSNAHVIAVSKSSANLEALKAALPASTVTTVAVDLSDWDATRAALEPILAKIPVDGLVNNAAVADTQPFLEMTKESLEWQVNVNLLGNLNVAQLVAQAMVRNKRPGSIVNCSSQASMAAIRNHLAYSACKGGIDQATRNMALELGPHGIRANTVNPTVVLTDMSIERWSPPEVRDPMLAKIPLGRFAQVQEIVDAYLFLLSDKSTMINGVSIPVDGGFLAT